MGKTIWWEVWLRQIENPDEALKEFRQHAALTGLQVGSIDLQFPERTVVLTLGTRQQMTRSLELLELIAELRLARINPEEFLQLLGSKLYFSIKASKRGHAAFGVKALL